MHFAQVLVTRLLHHMRAPQRLKYVSALAEPLRLMVSTLMCNLIIDIDITYLLQNQQICICVLVTAIPPIYR